MSSSLIVTAAARSSRGARHDAALLGQNPSEEELKELIDSVDDGDKDGQIQLREFLLLYTNGLDTKNKGS